MENSEVKHVTHKPGEMAPPSRKKATKSKHSLGFSWILAEP